MVACQKKELSDYQRNVDEGDVTFLSDAQNAARLDKSLYNTAFPITLLGNENFAELKSVDSSFGYYYLAAGMVHGPSIWGGSLKGTDIEISGDKAYLGYHIPGPVYGGAIDIVDISDPEDPQLLQTVLFADMDILSIDVFGQEIYVSGSRDTEVLTELPFAAAVAKADLSFAGTLVHGTIEYASIPGAVATEVTHTAALIYATSVGPDGGVQLVNKSNVQHVASIPLDDARAIAMDPFGAGYFVMSDDGGDDIAEFYPLGVPTPAFGYTLPVGIADDARTAMELSQVLPFVGIANGANGATILDQFSGFLVDFIPLPIGLLGVNPSDIYTNDVSWDGDVLYAANGGAGLQVSRFEGLLGEFAVYGSVQIGESANAVATDDGTILVLGATGLRIFTLEKIDFSPLPPPIPLPTTTSTKRKLAEVEFGVYRTGQNQAHHFMGESNIASLDVNSKSHFSFDGKLYVNGMAAVKDAVLESKGHTTFKQSLAIDKDGAYIVDGDVVIDGDFYFQGKVIFQTPGSSLQVFGKVYKTATAEVINPENNLGTTL